MWSPSFQSATLDSSFFECLMSKEIRINHFHENTRNALSTKAPFTSHNKNTAKLKIIFFGIGYKIIAPFTEKWIQRLSKKWKRCYLDVPRRISTILSKISSRSLAITLYFQKQTRCENHKLSSFYIAMLKWITNWMHSKRLWISLNQYLNFWRSSV